MRPDISEFSYGYAITEGLINGMGGGLTAAPVFPSLHDEGKKGGGFDVRLQWGAVALFLQFKVSDYMIGENTREQHRHHLFEPPFYRVHLRPMRHSQQHRWLLELESKGQAVYYAAPAFHTIDDLNVFYSSRNVVCRSVYIRPSAIGELPDDSDHHITLKLDDSCNPPAIPAHGYLLSEPRELEVGTCDDMAMDLVSRLETPRSRPPLDTLDQTMLEILRANPGNSEAASPLPERGDLPYLELTAYLARVYFGCELFLVRRQELEQTS